MMGDAGLPVEALAAFLRDRAAGATVARIDVASLSAVKTFDPPLHSLLGATVTTSGRYGTFLDIDISGLHLVVHFSRAGWLHWRESLPAAPPRPGGKGPIALRMHLAVDPADSTKGTCGFDLTEAGTQKRLSVYLTTDPQSIPGIARLGPDALSVNREQLTELLRAHRAQIKGALIDQTIIAGIGNAYSDEILHAAQLSPLKNTSKRTDDDLSRLCTAMRTELTEAVVRSVGQAAATLKGEKRTGLECMAKLASHAPSAATRSVRCRSLASRSSTARHVRRMDEVSPTGACPAYSSD